MSTRASVVVLGFGAEPYLADAVAAVLAGLAPDDELIVVDNGIGPDAAGALDEVWAAHGAAPGSAGPAGPAVRRIGDGTNRGFTGGCRAGVEASFGEVVVFVNSDAIVRPGALSTLIAAARSSEGIVGGCLRLADRPELVNSVGNPLHFLGITWAGHCGEPADRHLQPGPVTIATGGFFALRRSLWDRLGGFDDRYFAYHEDADLSLRAWLIGVGVRVEPSAVADHHYEFGRSPLKMYLSERNRWYTVLTDYPADLLRVVLPVMLAMELPLLVMALLQGWARQKTAAWAAVLRQLPATLRRRRLVQAGARADSAAIAALLVDRIEPPMVAAPLGMALLNAGLAKYWDLARPRAGRSGARSGRRPARLPG